ncbi:thiol reductant ABC exporter subunit CydD [Williamsia phyllosphaerae]|uniref:ATP-binding protein ABC transporter CydD n=1 Tax=Williamsia phyllosphaerae TaxID=885042 RepID=A0ABQ1V6E4_9NOCA|nr:thiol reductant ABC exporter subunit CydD [Williamsia phyllosphaerae]GGF37964.1 putative ATP-binding protein ABC transporter CydD [Williamsia phyllosphaerae]
MSTTPRPPIDPRLLRRSPSARRYVVLTSVMGVVTAAAVIVGAVAIAAILSELVTDPGARSVDAQQAHLVMLAVAFVVRVVATLFQDRYAHRASAAVIAELRGAALRTLTDPAHTSPRDLQRRRGDLVTVLTRGLEGLGPYLTSFVPSLVLSVTVTPAVIVVMAFTDLTSAVIVVVTLPLIPVFMVLIGLMTRHRTRARLDAMNRQAAQLLDLVAGIPTLRALHRADEPADRVSALGQANRRSTMGALRIAFLSGAVLELLATLCVAVVAVGIGLRLVYGDMGLYAGILALILAPEVYLPLRSVGTQFHNSEAGRVAADDVLAILDPPVGHVHPSVGHLHASSAQPTSVSAQPTSVRAQSTSVTAQSTGVEFVGVGIVDRDGWAPRGLTARCERGAITVITGDNGTGKSTTLQAIAGLIRPDEGVVLIGDTPVSGPAVGDIAWLAEPPVVLPGSVADNLSLFDADRSSIDTAARAVGFDTVVRELPDGIDTLIGTGGVGISAGQRQRLALTRVLASPARLLLLDEPTAHLDDESEARVMDALRARAAAGDTVIVVSHRPAVLACAERVIEMGAVRV